MRQSRWNTQDTGIEAKAAKKEARHSRECAE
jgi:hypothetical protein